MPHSSRPLSEYEGEVSTRRDRKRSGRGYRINQEILDIITISLENFRLAVNAIAAGPRCPVAVQGHGEFMLRFLQQIDAAEHQAHHPLPKRLSYIIGIGYAAVEVIVVVLLLGNGESVAYDHIPVLRIEVSCGAFHGIPEHLPRDPHLQERIRHNS